MQVGISQLIVPGDTIDFLRQAAAAGYEVAELALRATGDLNPQVSDDHLKRIRSTADELGIKLVSMTHTHCTGNLLDSGAAQQTSLDETCRGLQIARKLGIGCTLHTLGRLRPDLYYDQAYDNAVDSLRKLAVVCDQHDVDLAVEFVWNGFAFSPLEMRQLLDAAGSNRIGFYFDPGNMAVFQYPHHWVRILGRHIKMVHLKDWKGRALNGGWPALLEGEVDYAAMNAELRAVGYDGPMISEVVPSVASLEDTAAAIRKIIAM